MSERAQLLIISHSEMRGWAEFLRAAVEETGFGTDVTLWSDIETHKSDLVDYAEKAISESNFIALIWDQHWIPIEDTNNLAVALGIFLGVQGGRELLLLIPEHSSGGDFPAELSSALLFFWDDNNQSKIDAMRPAATALVRLMQEGPRPPRGFESAFIQPAGVILGLVEVLAHELRQVLDDRETLLQELAWYDYELWDAAARIGVLEAQLAALESTLKMDPKKPWFRVSATVVAAVIMSVGSVFGPVLGAEVTSSTAPSSNAATPPPSLRQAFNNADQIIRGCGQLPPEIHHP